MAELNARIIAKASATAGEEPVAGDLEVAELAVNTADGKLFTKHTDNSIVAISGGGDGAIDVDYDQDPTFGRFNWRWDATYDSSSNPGNGIAWAVTYPVNYLWFTTVDNSDIDCETELYALTSSDNLKLYRNDTLIYEGAGGFFQNKDSGKITIQFGTAADVDNSTFASGDIIGLESDTWVGNPIEPGNGYILQYDTTPQAWTPVLPGFVSSVNGQKVNVSIGVTDLFELESDTPPLPSYAWNYSSSNTALPPTGVISDYTPYGASSFFVSTTDSNGVDLSSELYASFANMKIKVWVNGEVFYDGLSTRTLNVSGNRIDLQMDGADVTSWSDGDTIGLWTELLPDSSDPTDKSIIYYDDSKSSWAYGQTPLAIEDSADFQNREQAGQLWLTRTTDQEISDFGNKGYWSIAGGGDQLDFSKHETEIIDNLSNGDPIALQVPGMASPFSTTLTSDPQAGTGKLFFFNISPLAPTEITSAPAGTKLTITSVNLGSNPSAPLDGDVLQWVEADQKFVPAQLTLDEVTTAGSTTDNDISVGSLLTVQGDGSTEAGSLKLNCSANTHGVTIKSPPHSAAATYSLVLPNDTGSAGQVLSTDGTGTLSWSDNSGEGGTVVVTSSGDLTSFPLCGPDAFYSDQAALEADGFTYINSSQDADDSELSFTAPAGWDGIDFLNCGYPSPSSRIFRVNTNGGFGYDSAGDWTDDRSGNALTDAAGLDFYASFWSQDTETRIAGWKEYTTEGRDWLVIRADMKVPYDNSTGGFPVECWFAKDGSVSMRYGTKIGTDNNITVGENRNVIVSQSAALLAINPLPGVSETGNYVFNGLVVEGMLLGELADVNTSTTPPTNGQTLIYDATYDEWKPGNAAGVDRIQDQTDFALNEVTGTYSGLTEGTASFDDIENTSQWHVSTTSLYVYPDPWNSGLTVGDQVTITKTGGTPFTYTIDGITPNHASSEATRLLLDSEPDASLQYQENGNYTGGIEVSSTGIGAVAVPLSDGDILQWVEADQKFKPSSDYVSLATLKTETAAATDFADFQSRIAAL